VDNDPNTMMDVLAANGSSTSSPNTAPAMGFLTQHDMGSMIIPIGTLNDNMSHFPTFLMLLEKA